MTRARDVANLIGSGNYSSTTFTATAGQTAFSISHTQGFIQVFMNGLLLDETVDYTSNGSAVTLTSGAAAGDEIEVVAYNTFSVGDALNQAAADTRYVNATGDTMTGNLTVDTQVGIGSSPDGSETLTVAKSSGTPTIRVNAPSGSEAQLKLQANGGGTTIPMIAAKTDGSLSFSRWTGAAYTERMRIDNEGRVTTPYQPAFNVSSTGGSKSSGVTIIGSTAAQTPSVLVNVGSHFATGTGRFTAPVAGNYYFYGYANFSTSSGGPAIRFIKNGSISLSQNNYIYNVQYQGASVGCVATLAVNDYVYLECNHYNHVTSTIYTSGVTGFLIG